MGSIIIKDLNEIVNPQSVIFTSNTDNDPNSALTGCWTYVTGIANGRGVKVLFIQTLNVNPTYSNFTTTIAFTLF